MVMVLMCYISGTNDKNIPRINYFEKEKKEIVPPYAQYFGKYGMGELDCPMTSWS